MALTLDKEISAVKAIPMVGPTLANGLQRIQDAINSLGTNTGADPTQTLPQPPTIQGLTVKTNGGLVHAVITDNNPIQKGLKYFLEYDTNPAFPQPHVLDSGASRTVTPFVLPAKDDNGAAQQFYFRAYSQYPGGHPGVPFHFGGTQPSPVSVGGTFQMTLVPSTGSGTAAANGQQGGSGLGKVLYRSKT